MKAQVAVQFGAGQIGRGFTGALFHETGLDLVFVEAVEPLVQKLNEKGRYTLHIVGEGASDYTIARLKALHISEKEAIADSLAQAVIACTAVGVQAMNAIAPLIAAGVRKRHEQGNQEPINILICENQLHGDQMLREAVKAHLPDEARQYLDENVGFVLCVVSRMVPIATDEERQTLEIRAEAYKRLPCDKSAFRGEPPKLVGLLPVDNFDAYIERKLFVHNASHAILGYLGALKGYEFGYEALQDEEIYNQLEQAMTPVCEAMSLKHGFTREEMFGHLHDLLRRYSNRDLGDTIFRLARDPMRKLRPDDRLIGAALLVREHQFNIEPIAYAIAAALRFKDNADPSSLQLQEILENEGVDGALKKVCGLDSDSSLAKAIKQHYANISLSSYV